MATTSRPIEIFIVGFRDSTGTAVASGIVRFYQPGTLITQTVFSDAACASAISQPVTLNAAGQSTIYTLEPVRCIVKDATDTTTLYDAIVNLNRHDPLYVTSAGWNGGAETTLEAILTTLSTNLGVSGQYKPFSGATARNYSLALSELTISVKDFGAVGDGSTDDTTAIQAAVDQAAANISGSANGAAEVYFPEGTYKITAAISSTTVGVCFRGAGRTSIIKNFGTSNSSISINVGSAVDGKAYIRDLAITCNTTSSAKGIVIANGNNCYITNVSVALHRTGIDVADVTGSEIDHCFVDSTDSNAAGIGFKLGIRTNLHHCVASDGSAGTAVSSAAVDCRIEDVYVSAWTTGISSSGARTIVRGIHIDNTTTGISISGVTSNISDCTILTPTTGISLTGAISTITGCYINQATTAISLSSASTESIVTACTINGATTGVSLAGARCVLNGSTIQGATTAVSVGAVAGVTVVNNIGVSNTTDLSVNASASSFFETGNLFTTITNASANVVYSAPRRTSISTTSSASANPSYTPLTTIGVVQHIHCSNGGAATGTINNPTQGSFQAGDVLEILLSKAAGGTFNPTFDTKFLGKGSGSGVSNTLTVPAGNQMMTSWWFNGTNYYLMDCSIANAF